MSISDKLGFMENIEKQLKEMGYPESVWLDEFQAYLFTEKKDFFRI